RGQSCVANLLELLYIGSILDVGGQVDAVYLDMSKAFDENIKNKKCEQNTSAENVVIMKNLTPKLDFASGKSDAKTKYLLEDKNEMATKIESLEATVTELTKDNNGIKQVLDLKQNE
ncbi:Hypothetical predicted protein, partial [Paramuricea clavata]